MRKDSSDEGGIFRGHPLEKEKGAQIWDVRESQSQNLR